TRTTVLRFSQDYLRRDPWGAWVGSSNFNFGLGVFDATENDAPTPDGRFFSWLGQFQRVQRLNQRHVLLTQLDIQFSPNTLLPSQQFTIGGGQSIRGYRQNLLIADNGFRFSVEDRITLMRDASGLPSVQLAPFLDVGAAINTKNNPNSLSKNQNVLAGLGVGILWDPRPDFSLRLDYGYPLVDLDVGENIQDQALYFNGSFQF
ncbi:MAG: ShlB/FhaC/HecB family hemolysin secretion/activation protein, partial [Prochlorotrichaceae cyanobacterium]